MVVGGGASRSIALVIPTANISTHIALISRQNDHFPKERIAALCTRLLGAVNIVLGSVGYLHVIMLVMFAGPAGIFATGIKEIFDDAYREAKEDRP